MLENTDFQVTLLLLDGYVGVKAVVVNFASFLEIADFREGKVASLR